MFDMQRTAFVIALAAIGAVAPDAGATSMIKASTEDLAHLAHVIVVGEVEDVVFEHEGRGLVTRNEVRVIETWKGDVQPGRTISVIEAGGRADAGSFSLEGSAGYLKKERVVLFLEARGRGFKGYLTLGMYQGKFTVLPAAAGKLQLARVIVPLKDRGEKFELAKIAAPKFVEGDEMSDLSALSAKVKAVVASDRAAGIHGRDLPQYRGITR